MLGPASPGAMYQQVLHAVPGYYVEACFMDTQGRPRAHPVGDAAPRTHPVAARKRELDDSGEERPYGAF